MTVVVSVNVGLPRDVPWQGQTVRTAIWKLPVETRVRVGRLNIAGDGQGDLKGHGGEHRAAMVYQLDSYRYWEQYLHRSDFVHGQFGENLTVDGLADTEVCIGDRYRIGGAVFEVSQPRVTCYRLGIRMNQADMPALVVSHHRPGFYFRVIEEGEIGAGDQIVKIADGPERMTVAEIDALLYLRGHSTDALQRALRIPALSPGWQESLRALLAAELDGATTGNAGLSPTVGPVAWSGFRPLGVVSSTRDTEDVRSFVLGAADGSPLPAALPGQYIVIKVRVAAHAPALARSYSLSGPPTAGTYRITVKREVGGVVSAYLHERMQIGDRLDASAPRGTFTLAAGARPVVLLSAGVGATPVLAMLYAVVAADGRSPRDVWWIHGARDGAHHCFAVEARDLIASLTSGHMRTVYSRPRDNDQLGRDYDAQGHVGVSLLESAGVPRDAAFYLCGPAGFLDDMPSALKAWGVTESDIHTEVFGPGAAMTPGIVRAAHEAPHVPAGEPGAGPTVAFVRSGLAVPWNSRYQSVLELAEACAVPVRWSCRTGVCHTCECALVDGRLRYSPDPLDPPADGNALICCATPTSDVQLDL
jgi:ferredoxin-NADP reductase/MOSC domain-containing protein YiiM/ferredoxin